jgi:1-acyl-sn-glycerol-3-phosphate acyltransferase
MLIVSNHISWLDVFVLNALSPAAFVCKDEVRRWPLIGWLCARTDTVFLNRSSRRSAHRCAMQLREILIKGAMPVAVFPEGTTTTGREVLPFRSALLQAAAHTAIPTIPVALRYEYPDGTHCAAPAYDEDTTFAQSLTRIFAAPGLRARVAFLPALDALAMDRRALARETHQAIRGRITAAAAAANAT